MLGWLFNTLSYRLRSEIRGWRKTNSAFRESAWPWYQKALIVAGDRPIRVPLEILGVVVLLSGLIWGYHVLSELVPGNSAPQTSGVEQHFFALWAVQAGVAAMIYPIVIGFVTLLLQRRHSAKASLHIYLHDSAAIVTGMSALFLVAAMGIQYFFISIAGGPTLTHWLILDGLWFVGNILGVIWFLSRTFDYLRPEKRAVITRSYAVNHVWSTEMRRNLEYNLFLGAIHYGWLPGPTYSDEKSRSSTAILISPIGQDMGDVQVTDNKKDDWVVHDVRFRPLRWAIRSWQRREEKLALSQGVPSNAFSDRHHSRLLVLPSVPGARFEAQAGLCRTKGSSGLCWWERWLVRRSFVLSSSERKAVALSIGDILNDLITGMQVAMEAREEVAFREALHEVLDLHAALIRVGSFVNDDGLQDNYANLSDRDHAFNARMHELWSREYRRLMKAAVEQLAVNDTYFGYMAHVAGSLIARLDAGKPVAITQNLLHLSRFLHYRLNRWWSKTGEQQGLFDHEPCEPIVLKAPSFAVYQSAIMELVGTWESLKNSHFPPVGDENVTWADYQEFSALYSGHLEGTLYLMFDSLSLGNKEGAEWLCDSLQKWWEEIRFRFDDAHFYLRDEHVLTLELLRKPWEAAKDVIDLSMPGSDESRAPKALWAACVHNHWVDLCCVSLYALLTLGKNCLCEKSLPAQLAVALGQGRALRAGGAGFDDLRPVRTVEDLLIAILRQYYFDGGYARGYRARLDKVVEGIAGQGKEPMVAGRIYSGWGGEDLESMRDGQLLLLNLLVKKGWTPSNNLLETIQEWGQYDVAGLRAFVGQLKQWKARLRDTAFTGFGGLFSCIQAAFDAVESFDEAIAALDAGIDQVIDGLEVFHLQQLRDAPVSNLRLGDVARWASKSGFDRESAGVPVALFRQVQHTPEEYTEHTLTMKEMKKGEFTEPPMAQRAGNEQQWFDRTVNSHVANSVMAQVLKELSPEAIDVDSPLAYWQQIEFAASGIHNQGGTPILLVAGRAEPRWLSDWARSTFDDRVERPEGLRLLRDNRFEADGYLGSLNDVPVFVGRIGSGSSYLISKEALDTVRFTEFEDGVYVRASVEPVEGNDALINLRLSWRFQLDLLRGQCLQLRYFHNR